ncbi:AP endonuclease [Pseudomonas silvicola]|nr:AP endonuclease [Pseudomonas silvicola]
MNLYPVSISLSSYGATLIREKGQAPFASLLKQAGADVIEWREELFTAFEPTHLRDAAQAQGLSSVYSAPLELWEQGRAEPNPALIDALANAAACGSRWLKVSLGFFAPHNDFDALNRSLAEQPVRLLVENDQTVQGGRIDPLVRFFTRAKEHQVPVAMTFDIGNWQWQEQSVFSAAVQLGQYVEYVHCKAVERTSVGKLVAIPPSAKDLQAWDELILRMAPGVMRAAEFPLQGEDLLQVTRGHVATLARLGQPHSEAARHG